MNIKGEPRYQRQMILKDFGRSGQEKLYQSKVLVIGAGGLGSPVLQYLAAAGIGTLGIVDNDRVELTNLHRQILYTVADIGRLKVTCAAERLTSFNPDITITTYPFQLTNQNALAIIEAYDIVIDGSDNFPTRYMVNDCCVLLNKPLIYAALSETEGQVAVFNVADAQGVKVNYRDLFPAAPQAGEVLNCAEAGVIGVLPGIIGTMQANEAIKLISGIGKPLINHLLIYNAYTCLSYQIKLTNAGPEGAIGPVDQTAFLKMDYNWFCNIVVPSPEIKELNQLELEQLQSDDNLTIIDVRELHELPEITSFNTIKMPLSKLRASLPVLEEDRIVLICQSGVRSVIAGELLHAAYPEKEFFSLRGGVSNLNQ